MIQYDASFEVANMYGDVFRAIRKFAEDREDVEKPYLGCDFSSEEMYKSRDPLKLEVKLQEYLDVIPVVGFNSQR